MMTGMGARRSSKFSQIRSPTAKLAALERLKTPHRLILRKTVLPLFLGCSWSNFILAGNDDIHESLDEMEFGKIRLLVSMATDRILMEKTVLSLFLGCFLSNPFHTCR